MAIIELVYLHLGTVLPAFLIGSYLLINRKGTPLHKLLGKIYVLLMLVSAGVTLFMAATVGPVLLGHFGFIHLLSFFVLFMLPRACFAARNGNIDSHKRAMVSIYIGGILVAGSLAFSPGRMLHGWLFY